MIRKSGSGYRVVSHTGKNLSKPGLTRAQARRRLIEIEYFKRQKGKK